MALNVKRTTKIQWKLDTCKKCTLYKYLPYTVQCRSYSKKNCRSVYNYSIVLGAAIKCKPYSEITVDIGTHLKTVKIHGMYLQCSCCEEKEAKLSK